MRTRLLAFAVAGVLAIGLMGAAPATAAGKATLNVVHGIPGVDVNVCVDGALAIGDFQPGDVVSGVRLPAGSHDLKVVAKTDTCGDTAILTANNVILKVRQNYTVVANLDAGGTPNLEIFTNDVRELRRAGSARLTVRHTADAPAVDVWANGKPLIRKLTWGHGATLAVPRGLYAAWVSLPGKVQPVIGPNVLVLRPGFAYQVYAWGNGTSGYHLAVVATQVGTK